MNKIIISLTSYPARINTVRETIQTLLNQTKQADKVVLWLSKEEFPHKEKDLPETLLALQTQHSAFSIEWCDKNMRSYNKLIPALQKYPNDIIVTADDDLLYDTRWLELLYNGYCEYPESIQCHRAFRILYDLNKNILPYKKWLRGQMNHNGAYGVDANDTIDDYCNFFTGCSGVLYPPHCLHPDVFNYFLAQELCPTEDDVWFFIMAIRQGTRVHVVENNMGLLTANTNANQQYALYNINSRNNTTQKCFNSVFKQWPDTERTITEPKTKLIISLTSYPARINTVHETIQTLLNQTKQADKVVLWLSKEEFPHKEKDLPETLLALQTQHSAFSIEWCDKNMRSYKKLIPTLQRYPNDIIVTADDDLLYDTRWLELLYTDFLKYKNKKLVFCHRITRLKFRKGDLTALRRNFYSKQNTYYKLICIPSVFNKLSGGAGALYSPHCFDKEIFDSDKYFKIAPTSDDIWFWIQALRMGYKVKVVKNNITNLNYVPDTQDTALCKINDINGLEVFKKHLNNLLDLYPDVKSKLKRSNFINMLIILCIKLCPKFKQHKK